jgi:hypothetical protein
MSVKMLYGLDNPTDHSNGNTLFPNKTMNISLREHIFDIEESRAKRLQTLSTEQIISPGKPLFSNKKIDIFLL